MASGKPIVASDINGYRNVMKDGCEGLFVTPSDPLAYAEAIMQILENEDLAEQLGESGRERAEQFSWERIVPQLVEYYLEVMEGCADHKQQLAVFS
jgi:phosphatidylinositol alpha-mannosyltransferase